MVKLLRKKIKFKMENSNLNHTSILESEASSSPFRESWDGLTPSQTVGPFFSYSLTAQQSGYPFKSLITNDLTTKDNSDTESELIHIVGQVLDGNNVPIFDALIELQSENALGRCDTGANEKQNFEFKTFKPKSSNRQAPHLQVIVLMRGLLIHAYTRLYFSDEMILNQQDEVLNSVPENRRHTLIAQRNERNGKIVYTWNIKMQGEEETVFFDL
jgi:protocatechuate 3,4-dioxygenase, alpha subunit